MLVENTCQALLAGILSQLESTKLSYSIEIGCGTFAFYCELFDRLGLRTLAVEPLPVANLKKLCKRRKILLEEACVAEHDGTVDLYMGHYLGNENLNLNSTRPNWWGTNGVVKRVPSITLKSLISKFNIEEVSCLKIDIEGAEYSVLSQIPELDQKLIPKVLMFEYGGGGTFQEGRSGWAPEFLEDTVNILNLLKNLGYRQLVQIDSQQGFHERILDLKTTELNPIHIFSPENIYGNFIALQENIRYPESEIHNICKNFRDNHLKPASLNIDEPLSKRVSLQVRRLLYR